MSGISLVVPVDLSKLARWLEQKLGITAAQFATDKDVKTAIAMFIKENSSDPGADAFLAGVEKYSQYIYEGDAYAITICGEGSGFIEAHRALTTLKAKEFRY